MNGIEGDVRETNIDLIREMQAGGYFVLLFFIGLTNSDLSVQRLQTRVSRAGHGIPEDRLRNRFPRTQRIIAEAAGIADATIMADNSRTPEQAYTVCRIQLKEQSLFHLRDQPEDPPPPAILTWLDVVAPHKPAARPSASAFNPTQTAKHLELASGRGGVSIQRVEGIWRRLRLR